MNSFIVSLIPLLILLIIKIKKAFHMLQQNWYNKSNRYLKWINKNKNEVFFNYDLVFFLLVILGMSIDMNIMVYLYCIAFSIVLYIYLSKKKKAKKPLVFTARVKRLSITLLILY